MDGWQKIGKSETDFIVTWDFPGIYGFINFLEQKAWISYTENVIESLVRNVKIIKAGQHKVPNLQGWEIVVLEKTPDKSAAKKMFSLHCEDLVKKGFNLLNKQFKREIWGKIRKDFRNPECYLFYVFEGSIKNPEIAAIFENARIGEQYIKDVKKGKPIQQSLGLLAEFKAIDKNKQEYEEWFKNEALY
jgi:hypothetical protein